MPPEDSGFGHLLKGYLFFTGKSETELADKIGLSLNKLSAGIHGKYRLKRYYFNCIVTVLVGWGVELTPDDRSELLNAWRSATPQRLLRREPDHLRQPDQWQREYYAQQRIRWDYEAQLRAHGRPNVGPTLTADDLWSLLPQIEKVYGDDIEHLTIRIVEPFDGSPGYAQAVPRQRSDDEW